MLIALSAGQEAGLAAVAGSFIVFALASALWIPRFRPEFPGRGLRVFVVAVLAFTAATLTAVVVLAAESEEKPEAATTESVPTTAPPPPTTATTTAPKPPPAAGNPAAGKTVYASSGCGSCHVFTPAGTNGKVGPDLDRLAEYATRANQGPLADFTRTSIVDPNAYVEPGFPKGVMPSTYGSQLSQQQLSDLTAFLTQKP